MVYTRLNSNIVQNNRSNCDKLEEYATSKRSPRFPFNKKATYKAKTVQDVDIELKNVPKTELLEAACLKIAAAREILSIPPDETKARCVALADAYVLAQAQEKSDSIKLRRNKSRIKMLPAVVVVPIAGTIGLISIHPVSWLLAPVCLAEAGYIVHLYRKHPLLKKAIKDSQDIKELTENLLLENNVYTSKYLEKISYSEMDTTIISQNRNKSLLHRDIFKLGKGLKTLKKSDLHGSRACATFATTAEADPMRICKSSGGRVPVNTAKTRKHLNHVFRDSPDLLAQLIEIINNRDNFSECPNDVNTEGGRFSVQGWRNVLALGVNPDPDTDQSHSEAEVTSVLTPTTTHPPYDTVELSPAPAYSSVIRVTPSC